MTNFARLYDAKQAMIVHATATNYRERSHFDGQDVLESGRLAPGRTESGWLNRAVAALPKGERVARRAGLAVGVYRAAGHARPGADSRLGALRPRAADRRSRRAPDRALRAAPIPSSPRPCRPDFDADRMASRQGMDALKPGGDVAPADEEGRRPARRG